MKCLVYSTFVSALLVSPLFVAVGCSGSVGEEDPCSIENSKACSSVARDETLICTDGAWRIDMKCTEGLVCAIRAEGPECVTDSGTGGTAGSGGTAGAGGSAGTGGTGANTPPVINYVGWEYTGGCTGFGDTELTVTISAFDADGDTLTYSGNVVSCSSPISIMSSNSPVDQTLLDCFSASIETVSVTVEDPRGATDSISASWESVLCEERCEEGEKDDLIQESCPVPWRD